MILWRSKPTTESELKFPDLGYRSWRWVLIIERWDIELQQQWRHGWPWQRQTEDDWRPCSDYYSINITKHFFLGMMHDYYDGPHHAFSLGFLHLNWTPRKWCKKCAGEE